MRSNFEIHGNGKSRILWKRDLFRADSQFHDNQSSPPGLPEVGDAVPPWKKVGERRSPRSPAFPLNLSTASAVQFTELDVDKTNKCLLDTLHAIKCWTLL